MDGFRWSDGRAEELHEVKRMHSESGKMRTDAANKKSSNNKMTYTHNNSIICVQRQLNLSFSLVGLVYRHTGAFERRVNSSNVSKMYVFTAFWNLIILSGLVYFFCLFKIATAYLAVFSLAWNWIKAGKWNDFRRSLIFS